MYGICNQNQQEHNRIMQEHYKRWISFQIYLFIYWCIIIFSSHIPAQIDTQDGMNN